MVTTIANLKDHNTASSIPPLSAERISMQACDTPAETALPRVMPPSDASAGSNRQLSIIELPMSQVDQVLTEHLDCRSKAMKEVLQHLGKMSGKRLRPALTILSSMAVEAWNERSIVLGASVELVHLATLVHDDILDHATTRRHLPTVHTRWDQTTAILAGDWLFTRAYRLANSFESTLPGRWIADAACGLCEGEVEQNHRAGDWEQSESEYIQMLRGKTGELCSVSCRLGAWAANASQETEDLLALYGMNLGVAFQLFDDWLDLFGNSQQTGKSLFADLLSGKPTLPILRLLQVSDARSRSRIIQSLCNLRANHQVEQYLEELLPRLTDSDAAHYTLQTAKRFADEAIRGLDSLGDSPAKQQLCALAESAWNRQR